VLPHVLVCPSSVKPVWTEPNKHFQEENYVLSIF
jgi:hypothetical protein